MMRVWWMLWLRSILYNDIVGPRGCNLVIQANSDFMSIVLVFCFHNSARSMEELIVPPTSNVAAVNIESGLCIGGDRKGR